MPITRMSSFKTTILFILFLCISLFLILGNINSVYAETSIYRSAGSVATDGAPAYTNTTGCQVSNDGVYCSRPNATSYANLYFNSFGDLASFGIPQNATITKLHMRVKGKNSIGQYIGVNVAGNQCQRPSYAFTFFLGPNDATRELHVATSENNLAYCVTASNIDQQRLAFGINYCCQTWFADIDNFEIAFDYALPPSPTPTPSPTSTPTPTPPAPFLDLPWDYEKKGLTFNEAALQINSFFDHEYPLLSFNWAVQEPIETKLTVIKFDTPLRTEDSYSSHDGYDYGVNAKANFNDTVLAAGSGWATHVNSCGACGNAIHIDHGNGYQTRYYHLQKEGLIVAVPGEKVWVNSGESIGKLGFSGKVSPSGEAGAHIHFMVIQDKNKDGNFEDNIPDGLTDPFGWQSSEADPWETYAFTYNNINYTGNKSYYLWKKKLDGLNANLPANGGVFSAGKTTVAFPQDETRGDLNLQIQAESSSSFSDSIVSLGSTISVVAKDAFGNLVTFFTKPMIVTIDFTQADLTRFKIGTISIYSSSDKIHWVKEDSFTDYLHNTSTATINHLSYFAVMGELLDTIAPVTTAEIEGTRGEEAWYRSDVAISLKADDNDGGLGVEYTAYRVNDEDWQPYAKTLHFTDEGDYTLKYYSADKEGNIETIKTLSFNIDKTLPSVSANIDRLPDNNGWYNHPTTIIFTGEDSGSGIDTCTAPVNYKEPDKENAVAEGSCTDKAGNIGLASIHFKYDSTEPELDVSATSKGQIYTSGSWTNQGVEVVFTCTDNMSGVHTISDPIAINSEGENQSVSGSCTDVSGNKSIATFDGINIDKTAPVVNIDADPHSIWPPNGKIVPVQTTGSSSDKYLEKTLLQVSDEYGLVEPAFTVFDPEINQTIMLEARRDGDDKEGRKYIIQAIAEDKAGNMGEAVTTVVVPHDKEDSK